MLVLFANLKTVLKLPIFKIPGKDATLLNNFHEAILKGSVVNKQNLIVSPCPSVCLSEDAQSRIVQ